MTEPIALKNKVETVASNLVLQLNPFIFIEFYTRLLLTSI